MSDHLTGPLIDRLVGELHPVRRRRPSVDAAILIVLCAIELGLFLGIGMQRPDIGTGMGEPSFWWKLAGLGLLAAIGGATALLSFDPVRSPRPGLRWFGAALVLCLAAGAILVASTGGAGPFLVRLDWRHGVVCAGEMFALSLPPLAALGLLMRRGASTDLPGTSLAVGLAAAAWGAFVFVFACPKDDPLYLLVWFPVGCGAVAVVARAALPVLNRW